MPGRAVYLTLVVVVCALWAPACDDSLRLVVVTQGGSSATQGAAGAGQSSGGGAGTLAASGTSGAAGTTGGARTTPSAGNAGEAGATEAQGGAAGAADSPFAGAAGAAGHEGSPAVPVWDAAPRYLASFSSHAHPGQYIRFAGNEGVIANVDLASTSAREDASFEMIPGLYDGVHENCVSFRELNKPATFFRHSGSRIYLQPAEDVPLFFADATFCTEDGMADEGGVTFRSVNYPQRVIHLRNQNELWIDDVPDPMTPEFASDATFYREAALYAP